MASDSGAVLIVAVPLSFQSRKKIQLPTFLRSNNELCEALKRTPVDLEDALQRGKKNKFGRRIVGIARLAPGILYDGVQC